LRPAFGTRLDSVAGLRTIAAPVQRDVHVDLVAGHAPWSAACLNCGQVLSGTFCSSCGQRAMPPEPTLREFAGDAYAELAGWDGKVVRTIHLLLCRPGELTRRVLAGQRTNYISTVRLYLLCSVVYFLIAGAVPLPDFGTSNIEAMRGSMNASDAVLAKAMTQGLKTLSSTERAAVEQQIAEQPPVLRPLMRAMATDFPGLRRRVVETMPRALFVLLPVLALILRLFHRRRTFPVHLYFATHLQSFVFLILTVAGLIESSDSMVILIAANVVVTLVVLAYAAVAQRRVYGGGWPLVILKTIVIAALYGSLWSATSGAVSLWAAL